MLLLPFMASAQEYLGLSPELEYLYSHQAYSREKFHTAIHPWTQSELLGDSLSEQNFPYFVQPLCKLNAEYERGFRAEAQAGVYAGLNFRDKLFAQADFAIGMLGVNSEMANALQTNRIIEHHDRFWFGRNNFFLYPRFSARLSYKPIPELCFQVGKGRFFIGDGYRSLLLSDNAEAMTYGALLLNVWNLNYNFTYGAMADYLPEENFQKRHKKFIVSHTLSWNIIPQVNVYLFESVVWQKMDSLSLRGFEPYYLNPFMVIRPIEYNLSSPDNMMVGFGAKFRIIAGLFFYGQLQLDEFRISELFKSKGWWGNKYAYQLGIKYLHPKLRTLAQIEYNRIRPYNYSHVTKLQNYANLNSSLAHPDGANLEEFLFIGRLEITPKWRISVLAQYLQQGMDNAKFYGSGLYTNYEQRAAEYGVYTLQGDLRRRVSAQLKLSRLLIDKWHLQADLTIGYLLQNSYQKINSPYLSIGLSRLLDRN